MPQLPSFRRLIPQHQAFVNAYFRANCDPTEAMIILHPNDDRNLNVRRGWRLMERPDVKEAIGDLQQQAAEKHLLSREDMLKELYDLIARANGLPDAGVKLSTLKFSKDVLSEMAKVLGYNSSTVNTNEQRNITVQLVGIDDTAAPAPAITDATIIEEPKTIPDAVQMELSFPPSDPIPFSLDDFPEDQDDLPFDLDDDPTKDSSQD